MHSQVDQKCKMSGHFIALPLWIFNTGVWTAFTPFHTTASALF